jgi:putative ABC transport system permease protein
VIALATAVGLLTGLRAAMAISVSGAELHFLRLALLPVETLDIEWSTLAVWPAEAQRLGVERLMRVVAALAAAVVTVALLNAATLLAERSGAREREIAVRVAHGASTGELVRMLLLELRVLVLAAVSLGIPAGIGLGAGVRLAWPGDVVPPTGAGPTDLVASLLFALGTVATVHVWSALRPLRRSRLVASLRTGGRTGWDPAAVFLRRTLSAVHVALGGAVVVTAWGLATGTGARHPAVADTLGVPTGEVFVIPAAAEDPDAWSPLLQALRAHRAIEAESLATPGAVVGLGIRDMAITECGACSIGGLPAPLWNASAEVHSVAPGFHAMVGIPVLDGRGLLASDGPASEPVAVVSRRLAQAAFEDGRAVGKRLRVGDDLNAWYRVVGVADDRDVAVPGEDGVRRGSVYLSALQRPPTHGRILVRGGANAAAEAATIARAAGFRIEPPLPLPEYMALAAAPVRWAGTVVWLLGMLAALVCAHGLYLAALQTTRRRARDMAVRSALGSPAPAIVRTVLMERLRTTSWGLVGFVLLGTTLSAGLQKAAGLPAVGVGGYLSVSFVAAILTLAASGRAVREALAVEPATLLD